MCTKLGACAPLAGEFREMPLVEAWDAVPPLFFSLIFFIRHGLQTLESNHATLQSWAVFLLQLGSVHTLSFLGGPMVVRAPYAKLSRKYAVPMKGRSGQWFYRYENAGNFINLRCPGPCVHGKPWKQEKDMLLLMTRILCKFAKRNHDGVSCWLLRRSPTKFYALIRCIPWF